MGSYVSHLFLSWPFCHLHCGATGHNCFPRLSLAPGLWQIKFRVSVMCLLNIPVSQSISASNNRLSFKMSCLFSLSHKEWHNWIPVHWWSIPPPNQFTKTHNLFLGLLGLWASPAGKTPSGFPQDHQADFWGESSTPPPVLRSHDFHEWFDFFSLVFTYPFIVFLNF